MPHKVEAQKIGFVAGCMDLFHAGHVLLLKECKENCDHLIVYLQTDPTLDRPTKNIPVQTMEERRIQLEGCKYVDEIIEYDTEKSLLSKMEYLVNNRKENGKEVVRFLGEDYKGKEFTGDHLEIPIHYTDRSHTYSSSELRSRVIHAKNRVSIHDIKGMVMKDDETYRLVDNTSLSNLTVSTTELHAGKSTRGHKHDGLDEVYIILKGKGIIELDGVKLEIKSDDVILINEGVFHRLHNTDSVEDLVALCIFQKYDR
jgi:glycerol-3-phosphate cytidylyltransferase